MPTIQEVEAVLARLSRPLDALGRNNTTQPALDRHEFLQEKAK